ncbi:WcbI family polysaccharide biosynthesis putative acetyltransferase [Leisingera caerulea]|uniref:WcbI family polysaccharide biosynthesis putative acetyltransferase n=1 Tax=Leisingera caerulea TaxID=506591 RepID=UPI0021A3955C|nr:WcbI family polysaccharide biosynthesis putative acetyltransferase [Leisingera caerulea]UWQ86105.1 hypothetical protein K3726_21590 [Leisingera caerulea]
MKTLIIYSTCQGGIMSGLLKRSPEIARSFDIRYHTNFSNPGEMKCDIPDEQLADCALFLYHPIAAKNHGFSTDMLLEKLPDSAEAYVLPYVTFGSYWPELGKVPSKPLGVDAQFPYGRIPYRSEMLDALIDQGATPSEALQTYLSVEPVTALRRAEVVLEADTRYLDRLDSQDGPIKVKDYILRNFRNRQLFYIFNHPKTEIYAHMANQLLEYLGVPPLTDQAQAGFKGHIEQNMPIHPATASVLGLEFVDQDTRYDYLGESFTFCEFIERYLEYAYAEKNAKLVSG